MAASRSENVLILCSTRDMKGRPLVCERTFLTVIGWRGLFKSSWSWSRSTASICPWNSGRYFSTGSSTFTLPSSTRIISAAAVIGLDIEAIQKRLSVCIGLWAATSAKPTASRLRTLSFDATSVTAPASVCRSTNGCSTAEIDLGDVGGAACTREKGASRKSADKNIAKVIVKSTFLIVVLSVVLGWAMLV